MFRKEIVWIKFTPIQIFKAVFLEIMFVKKALLVNFASKNNVQDHCLLLEMETYYSHQSSAQEKENVHKMVVNVKSFGEEKIVAFFKDQNVMEI